MSEWISVKDRLPKEREDVLIFDSRFGVDIGCIFNDIWNDREYRFMYVTHWMPLPEPPNS